MATLTQKLVLASTVSLLLAAVWPQSLGAQSARELQPKDGQIDISSVQLGFQNQVVLGRWVPICVQLDQAPTGSVVLEVEALDGDAVPCRTLQTPQIVTDRNVELHGLVRIGRRAALTVRVTSVASDERRILAEKKLSTIELGQQFTFLPSTTRLTLLLGTDGGTNDVGSNQTRLIELDPSISDLTVLVGPGESSLPKHWLAYDSVRTLYIATETENPSCDKDQVAAIDQWVRYGGRVLVSSGRHARPWFGPDAPFEFLAPGQLVDVRQTRDTGAIEVFISSSNQLATSRSELFSYSVFETSSPNVDLQLNDIPLIVHSTYGFGFITFLAFDILDEPLKSWAGANSLMQRALRIEAVSESENQRSRSGRVSHVGYEDIVGQLRGALDRYKGVSFIAFTTVAILVALMILAIGPGDYLFLQRVVKRMEWTWLTFLFLSIGFCALAVAMNRWAKSDQIELNQAEIIDIDASQSIARGTTWTHMYSPRTDSYDVQLSVENKYMGESDQQWLSWQGLPGTGLGGMQARNDMGLNRRSYDCSLGDGVHARCTNVPLQNASTKSFSGRWIKRLDNVPVSFLQQSPNTDAVQGTFTNPLPVKLYNCVLLYDDWAYVLDRSLEPDETIDVETDTREKTIKGLFTRRKSGADDVNTPWDPMDVSLKRILEMMMLFESVGGQGYTTLTHDYQPYVDLSNHLKLGQAVLIGHIRDVTTPLLVDGNPVDKEYDKRMTMVRVVYPVKPRQNQTRVKR